MPVADKSSFAPVIELPIEIDFPHPGGGWSEFIFVRHGRTEGNVRRILVGRTDIPLDELGYRQAAVMAQHITALKRPDVIIASPLLRARETAQAIADRLDLPIEIEPDIAELNFGSYEGWLLEDIRAQQPEFAAQFADLNIDTHWPGGERLSEFHLRVRTAISRLATRYPSHTAVIVSHGGVLGSLAAQLLGTPPNDWSRYRIRNCSITHLEIGSKHSVFHRFNDCTHLDMLESDAVR
jgi:broad specificity phosphatase PhoE